MTNKMALLLSLLLTAGVAQANSPATATDVNNTKVNERDARMNTITPEDQSRGSAADVEVTRKIRQDLVSDKTLSTDAQNIKIITLNGVVTLRGPVSSQTEKLKIDALSKKTAGVKRVDNQIEVKTRVE